MIRSNGRQAERSEAAVARALDRAVELSSGNGREATSKRHIADLSRPYGENSSFAHNRATLSPLEVRPGVRHQV